MGATASGYAFAPKKEQTFIQPSLFHHASLYDIDFVPISIPDSTTTAKTLIEQRPFDCIIHKIYGPYWNQHLKEYSSYRVSQATSSNRRSRCPNTCWLIITRKAKKKLSCWSGCR
ncbi:hypothetical protein ACFX13_012699 [Malus domestica]